MLHTLIYNHRSRRTGNILVEVSSSLGIYYRCQVCELPSLVDAERTWPLQLSQWLHEGSVTTRNRAISKT